MAFSEGIAALHELSRHDGFAPVQWVLDEFRRQTATFGDDERHRTGAIQAHYDGPAEFALQPKYRLEARTVFFSSNGIAVPASRKDTFAMLFQCLLDHTK